MEPRTAFVPVRKGKDDEMSKTLNNAYQTGRNGTGTVNTNGMSDQAKKAIDAAVNAGRKDASKGK
ncbi:MAG: hypothetical protein CL535_19450 [Ahrensia sp.]|nr:hypothetical protein [Ahrensia sp.]